MVDRTVATDLADKMVATYTRAQTQLADLIATQLRAGIGAPDWAERKLAALGELRRRAETLLHRLEGDAADGVAQALVLAHVRGGRAALDEVTWQQHDAHRAALADLADGVDGEDITTLMRRLTQARDAIPGVDALQTLIWNTASRLSGTHLRVLRWAQDTYRAVIAETAAPSVILGLSTRRRAAQVAWERLLNLGVKGFTDKAGRQWELASYVEMATRTAVAQAATQSHLDTLGSIGVDLVIVSNAPQECPRCRPWEGKILDRHTPGARTIQLEHAIRDGEMVTVRVAGSVAEAVTAGLMHPNCRHSISAYQPGVTRPPTTTEDPDGDQARTQLRALERDLRARKLAAATPIDAADQARLDARVREQQSRIRDHVATTSAKRQPAREQIGVAR